MTLSALLAFQETPRAVGFTPTEWGALATAVITTAMLFWEKVKKQSKEDRTDTVAGFKDQADRANATSARFEAANVRLADELAKKNDEIGKWKDLLSAERVTVGRLEGRIEYLEAELAERDGRPPAGGDDAKNPSGG